MSGQKEQSGEGGKKEGGPAKQPGGEGGQQDALPVKEGQQQLKTGP
jgi:hypothetical protein